MSITLRPGLAAPPLGESATPASVPVPSHSAGAGAVRTDRFLARVDAHLATLSSDAARRSFLRQQIAAWEFRRERFILTEGASEPVTDPRDPPHVADFTLTITGLQARLDALPMERAA
jgi:hypothetical protein